MADITDEEIPTEETPTEETVEETVEETAEETTPTETEEPETTPTETIAELATPVEEPKRKRCKGLFALMDPTYFTQRDDYSDPYLWSKRLWDTEAVNDDGHPTVDGEVPEWFSAAHVGG